MRTDLPPLTLAVVVLEQALVVGDTVLAEHETRSTTRIRNCLSYRGPSNRPSECQLQLHDCRHSQGLAKRNSIALARGARMAWKQVQNSGETYPAMRGTVRNILLVGGERRGSGGRRCKGRGTMSSSSGELLGHMTSLFLPC